MKRSLILLGVFVAVALAVGIFLRADDPAGNQPNNVTGEMEPEMSETTDDGNEKKNPIVTIVMEDGGEIEIELFPEIAPNTVNNFVSLARSGYYDGTIFHRVIPGFMIQGGDPEGTGRGGPGYSIRGEFSANGFNNDLRHSRGVISMARTQEPNSAGSQFFIMVADSPHLDRQYAAFGRVRSGIEVVDRIVATPRNAADRPQQDQRMERVTVEEFGVEYPEPEKM